MAKEVSQGSRSRLSYAQQSAPLIGREDTQFAEKMSLLERWVNPLTLMTMKLKRDRARTIDVHYFEDEYVPYIDQINFDTGYNSSDTDLTVDHGEYFAIGDMVRIVSSDEVVLVTGVSSDVVTVTRDFGQSTEGWTAKAASIADNDFVHVLSNGFEPGHPFPVVKSTQEIERINYCQDQRTPLSASEVNVASELRSDQDWTYQLGKASTEHMQKIERQNWFGKPYRSDKGNYVSGTGNTAPAQAGGVNHYITEFADASRKVDETDLTEFEFMDFLEAALEFGNQSKVLWCSPTMRTAFDKWGITRQSTFTTDTVMGMKVGRWQTSQGNDLMIVTHDMLKRDSTSLYNYTFILDMNEISWVTFGPNGSTRLRQAGNHDSTGETLDRAEYQTISCITIKQPNQHARLRFKTISV